MGTQMMRNNEAHVNAVRARELLAPDIKARQIAAKDLIEEIAAVAEGAGFKVDISGNDRVTISAGADSAKVVVREADTRLLVNGKELELILWPGTHSFFGPDAQTPALALVMQRILQDTMEHLKGHRR
jgi:hypothetical protein